MTIMNVETTRYSWVFLSFVGILFGPGLAQADDCKQEPCPRAPTPFRLDSGLTFSRFEQQVKQEVGGAKGEKIVEETQAGIALYGTYSLHPMFSLGLYSQFDTGHRSAGQFTTFDANGGAQITNSSGGNYSEFWLGPLLRFSYKALFAEVGYGALGLRWDAARHDLKTTSGKDSGTFTRHPTIAWMFALGGSVPIVGNLDLVLRMEYRVRYYNRRGGEALANNMVHGTQNFTPFAGVAYRFGL
jgi:hypothetical protein